MSYDTGMIKQTRNEPSLALLKWGNPAISYDPDEKVFTVEASSIGIPAGAAPPKVLVFTGKKYSVVYVRDEVSAAGQEEILYWTYFPDSRSARVTPECEGTAFRVWND